MEKRLNLTVLEEYLTTGVPADVLASELDEMAFDYAAATIHMLRTDADACPHDHVVNFIYYLKDLRDTLRQCVEG